MKRLSKEQVLLLHSQLIESFGGSSGVRDDNLLDSALETPFQSAKVCALFCALKFQLEVY